jgi:uncharacterized phiE125 gp8 family phage protein
MPLILETGPVNDPVTLQEVKEHIRVDSNDEDARIVDFIDAAIQRLDGRDGALGCCLITQTWTLKLDRFASDIAIPLPPCQSIDSITYVDPDGVTRTLASTEYQVFGLGTAEGATVRPAYGNSWPSIRHLPEAVSITFTAGFGDNATDIPEPIRTAIKMRVGHLYEHRESVTTSDGYTREMPDGPDDFTRNYKQFVF